MSKSNELFRNKMIIHKSYKFQLFPEEDQAAVLAKHGGNLRFAWNKLLEFANDFKELNKKFPSKIELRSQLKIIQKENDFLKRSHSQPIQDASDKLFDTFINAIKPKMIEERKRKIAEAHKLIDPIKKAKALKKAFEFGFPKFKRKSDFHDSIFYPQFFKIKKSRIFFPKIGWIDYKKHRVMEGTTKFLTITQDGNRWYVSLTNEVIFTPKKKVELKKANIVGIDVGLKTFATLSDGTEIQNPRTLKKYLRKLKKEQQILSRKELKETEEIKFGKKVKVSSNRRNKQIEKVIKVHRKVKNIRKDFLHKTSNQIITKFDGVILETLDIKSMLKTNSKAMCRSILDVSWYEFGRILEYKCLWNDKYFGKIDQYEPSSQKCNVCGNLQTLTLKDRIYVCPHCGNTCGRDLNASKNIRDSGMETLEREERLKNTCSTQGINARGEVAQATSTKREKLWIADLNSCRFPETGIDMVTNPA